VDWPGAFPYSQAAIRASVPDQAGYVPSDKSFDVLSNKTRRHQLAFSGEQAAGRNTSKASGSLFSQSTHLKLPPESLLVVKTPIVCRLSTQPYYYLQAQALGLRCNCNIAFVAWVQRVGYPYLSTGRTTGFKKIRTPA